MFDHQSLPSRIFIFIASAVMVMALWIPASRASTLDFDWDVGSLGISELADSGDYTLTGTLGSSGGSLSLTEGASTTVDLQTLVWSVSPDAEGQIFIPIDRTLTVDGIDMTIDQDFSFNSTFSSLFGGNIKNGTFFLAPVMTYVIPGEGTLEAQVLQTTVIPGLGATGTGGTSSPLQVQFTAVSVVPEPATGVLAAFGLLLLARRRGRSRLGFH